MGQGKSSSRSGSIILMWQLACSSWTSQVDDFFDVVGAVAVTVPDSQLDSGPRSMVVVVLLHLAVRYNQRYVVARRLYRPLPPAGSQHIGNMSLVPALCEPARHNCDNINLLHHLPWAYRCGSFANLADSL